MNNTVSLLAGQKNNTVNKTNDSGRKINSITKTNENGSDIFVKRNRKKIIIGSVIGLTVAMISFIFLAKSGKFGNKYREFINNIFNFSNKQKPASQILNTEIPNKTTETIPTYSKDIIKQEARLRTEQELIQKRKAEIAQSVEVAKIESKLSHKSAEESAEVFNKEFEAQEKIIKETLEQAESSQQLALGRYTNPKSGGTIKLATSDDTQIIGYIAKGDDGLYTRYSIIFDKDEDLSSLAVGPKLYSSDLNNRIRSRQFAEENWWKEFKEDFELASEKTRSEFSTLKEYAEYKVNPELYKKRQLKRIAGLSPTQKEHFLYRGIRYSDAPDEYKKILNSAKVGDVIVPDWGVACTTPTASCAIAYCSDSVDSGLLRIKVPKGAHLAGVEANGFIEFHMPSLSEYKLLDKHKVGNLTIFDLEYIIPDLSNIN